MDLLQEQKGSCRQVWDDEKGLAHARSTAIPRGKWDALKKLRFANNNNACFKRITGFDELNKLDIRASCVNFCRLNDECFCINDTRLPRNPGK